MNGRFEGNTMYLSHFQDFYYLEALRGAIAMEKANNADNAFRHSVERLESDVESAFVHLSHEMALRIYVYLWAASLGEARHASDRVSLRIKEIYGNDRTSVYRKALDFFPSDENIKLLKDVFDQKEWGGAYGGKAWYNIAEAMELYGKVNDATFIDHAVDLEHNGGCVFSKGADFGLNCYDGTMNTSDLKEFLNFKFAKNILETRKNGSVSSKVYRLIERFISVFLPVGTGRYVKMVVALDALKPELEWLKDYSVDWGYEKLTAQGKKGTSFFKKSVKTVTTAKTVKTAQRRGNMIFTVKEDADKLGGKYYYAPGMKQFLGRTMEFKKSHDNMGSPTLKAVNHRNWVWDRNWLIPADNQPKKTVTGKIVDGGKFAWHGTVHEFYKENGYWVTDDLTGGGGKDGKWLFKRSSIKFITDEREERRERRPYAVCYGCERDLREGETYSNDIDCETYCYSCYSDKFSCCENCGQEYYTEDLLWSESQCQALCESCHDRLVVDCDKCGEEISKDDAIDATNHHKYYWLCRECAKEEMAYCESCNEWHEDYIVTDDNSEVMCHDCADDGYCRTCEKYYSDLEWHKSQEHTDKTVILTLDADGIFETWVDYNTGETPHKIGGQNEDD